MIELPIKLQCVRCRTCGRDFAVDAMAYAEAMEAKSPLFCPIGNHIAHTWNDIDSREVGAINLQLLAENRQQSLEVNRLIRELAARPALEQAALDNKEIKRRAGILAARAESAPFGRQLCHLCGKPKSRHQIASHFARVHREQIEQMPAEIFS